MPRGIAKRRPRPIRTWMLMALVAATAAGLAGWREYVRPARVWRRAVRSPDPKVRARGWEQVWKKRIDGLDPDETQLEVLAATEDVDPSVRAGALRYAREMGRDPLAMIPLYVRMLGDADTHVRTGAVEAAGEAVRMARRGREQVVPGLLGLLADPDPWLRKCVLESLGDLARVGRGATDPLLGVVAGRLADRDEDVRIVAAHVLSRGDRGEEAIPLLERHMLDLRARNGGRDPGGTGTADNALARIAARSDEVLTFLLSEAYRPGQGLSNRFLFALQWIGGPARDRAVGMARAALEAEDRDRRIGAALWLESVGHAGETRDAWLEALRGHRDPDVRAHAIRSLINLGRLDPAARLAIRAAATDDPASTVRRAATAALWLPPGVAGPVGSPSPPTIPEARDAASNP